MTFLDWLSLALVMLSVSEAVCFIGQHLHERKRKARLARIRRP